MATTDSMPARVVVVGATGNVGTALLDAIGTGSDVVGVTDRRPDAVAPYHGRTWHRIDIAHRDAEAALVGAFTGADAVVLLAWRMQPNRDLRQMYRTNVEGTSRALRAAAHAGVRHVVVLSSVGAYSPGPKSRAVDETWPTGGIASSHYSRMKAFNERVLDRFEAAHEGIVVTRVRPGLVMQRRASAEIGRYFLGPLVPRSLLGRLPLIPLPRRASVQTVHASDLADALVRMLTVRAGGAFNIAADDVLDADGIAAVLGGRRLPMRRTAVRGALESAWRARLQPTDPGWFDLVTDLPTMDTGRAKQVLGWHPTVSARDAVSEVVDGLRDSAGQPGSPPLRPGRSA